MTGIAGLTIAATDPAATQAVYDFLGVTEVTVVAGKSGLVAGEPGLVAIDIGVDDLAAELRLARRRGLDVDDDGAMTVRGLTLRLVEAGPCHGTGLVSGLDHIVVRTEDVPGALAAYCARLGFDLRLDRSFPQWGMRELFVKCGDHVVEIVTELEDVAQPSPTDSFDGVAWQVRDIEAAQAELSDAGYEVSEVRVGRKKGTRVATLRDRRTATPTLLIEPVR